MSSYTPATKLSYANATECATVLSDGKVMVTMANGAPLRQMMKLSDWLILADGQQVSEDFIPVPKEEAAPAAAPAAAPLAAKPISVGTKFRWTLNPETYRIAIMTVKGLLQVKSVTDGGGEVHESTCDCNHCGQFNMVPRPPWCQRRPLKKTMFADESAWRASLPAGGTTSLSPPDTRDLIQKRVEQPLPPALSDVEMVNALLKRFKVKGRCYYGNSPSDNVALNKTLLLEVRAKLNALTIQEMIESKSHQLITELNYRIRKLRSSLLCQPVNSNIASVKPIIHKHSGTSRFFAKIGGKDYEINTLNNRIVILCDPYRTYANFEEMGVQRSPSGKPLLSVLYRRRNIKL